MRLLLRCAFLPFSYHWGLGQAALLSVLLRSDFCEDRPSNQAPCHCGKRINITDKSNHREKLSARYNRGSVILPGNFILFHLVLSFPFISRRSPSALPAPRNGGHPWSFDGSRCSPGWDPWAWCVMQPASQVPCCSSSTLCGKAEQSGSPLVDYAVDRNAKRSQAFKLLLLFLLSVQDKKNI